MPVRYVASLCQSISPGRLLTSLIKAEELWSGNLFHHREVINYALDGSVRHILLHFSVFPGQEMDWSRVQVALADITARKKGDAYLEYLGKHDVLTKLYNSAFYADEMNRLERKSLRPCRPSLSSSTG